MEIISIDLILNGSQGCDSTTPQLVSPGSVSEGALLLSTAGISPQSPTASAAEELFVIQQSRGCGILQHVCPSLPEPVYQPLCINSSQAHPSRSYAGSTRTFKGTQNAKELKMTLKHFLPRGYLIPLPHAPSPTRARLTCKFT